MSRNNVFKLSGNMALGGGEGYGNNNDFDNIKNSLKLLKSKKAEQKLQEYPSEPKNSYGGSYTSSSQQRQPAIGKNLGSNDYPNNYNYPQTNVRTSNQPSNSYKDVYQEQQYNDYKPKRANQNYEQQNNDYKPKRANQNYEQQNNDYKPKRVAQTYEEPPRQYKQKKNVPTYEEQDYNQYSKPPVNRQLQQQQPPPQRQQEYGRQQPKGGNQFQQRSIKEVNRQNRVQIREYDPSELALCSEGCGRKFNPDSIDKHEAVCRKVFQKKRKEFNAQDQRIVANEQKKLMKRGELVQKKMEQKKAREKVPKWKAESLQLRVGIKQSQGDGSYKLTREEQQVMDANKANSTVKCQFCGRTFGEEPAKKHIPFCQSQQKKNQMKRR